jgi:hypothetical protein
MVKGIRFHKAIEDYYNGKTIDYDQDCKEWKQFLSFENNYNLKHKEIYPEYSFESVLGQKRVDMLVECDDGSYTIIDWKLSKLGSDTKHFDRYTKQLNQYREVLEIEHNKNIRQMLVVQFHKDLPRYKQIVVCREDHLAQDVSYTMNVIRSLRRDLRKQETEIKSLIRQVHEHETSQSNMKLFTTACWMAILSLRI